MLAADVPPVARSVASYTPSYQRFIVRTKAYEKQYSHIYTKRLLVLRAVVLEAAARKWGSLDGLHIATKAIDVRPGFTAEHLVIGCIYKEMALKPNILDEVSGDRSIDLKPEPRLNYCSAGDSVILEDESGRLALTSGHKLRSLPHGKAAWQRFVDCVVTGAVLGVRGFILDSGELAVEDFVVAGLTRLPGSPPRPPLPSPVAPAAEDGPLYLLLLSGLHGPPGAEAATLPFALQLLAEFVTGMVGDGSSAAAGLVSRIARVVVAGGAIGPPPVLASAAPRTVAGSGALMGTMGSKASGAAAGAVAASSRDLMSERAVSQAEQEVAAASLRDADALLAQIASGVAVDVMPGDREPSNHALPQQPLHPCLLPAATRFSSLRPVSNPYEAEVGGVRVLGHSGQPVADVLRYSATAHALSLGRSLADFGTHTEAAVAAEAGGAAAAPAGGARAAPPAPTELDALVNTLAWRHLAPTAPDTLTCYPFYDVDPFVIDDAHVPHLMFSGGSRAFDSCWVPGAEAGAGADAGGVRVVAVPTFWSSHTAVLVNLRSPTLDAEAIVFSFGPRRPEKAVTPAGGPQLPPGLLV